MKEKDKSDWIETSKMMRDLGFKWSCTSYFDEELKSVESTLDGYCPYNEVSNGEEEGLLAIPSESQAARWIKNEFDIDILPDIDIGKKKYLVKICKDFKLIGGSESLFDDNISALRCGVNSIIKFIYEKGKYAKSDFVQFIY